MEKDNEREDRLAVAKVRPPRELNERILESLGGKVNLPRQRTEAFLAENMKPGDVVQVNVTGWSLNTCLATVEDVRPWGLVAFVQLPKSGLMYEILGLAYDKTTMRAHVRLGWDQFINITGGSGCKNYLWNHDQDLTND